MVPFEGGRYTLTHSMSTVNVNYDTNRKGIAMCDELPIGGDVIGTLCPRCNGTGQVSVKTLRGEKEIETKSFCSHCEGVGYELTPMGRALVRMIKNSLLADDAFKKLLLLPELELTETARP